VLGRELAVLVTQVLAQLAKKGIRIDELHLALPLFRLSICQQPNVGGDASVVEQVVRQLDNGVE
jgi:hypothetical protein